jgi:hypothetical protein
MELAEGLPRVDSPCTEVMASAEGCWHALTSVVGKQMSRPPVRALAAVLGCADRQAHGPRDVPGSALAGFHVVCADPPRRWRLEGRHRFSEYALEFRVEDREGEGDAGRSRTRLCAETRATFPGWTGALYRALVIGSGGHRVAVRRLLQSVKRRAEADARRPDGSGAGSVTMGG